jgi:hypothetical protein
VERVNDREEIARLRREPEHIDACIAQLRYVRQQVVDCGGLCLDAIQRQERLVLA